MIVHKKEWRWAGAAFSRWARIGVALWLAAGFLPALLLPGLLLPALLPGLAPAAEAPARPLQARLEALLQEEGLAPEQVAVLLFSTARRAYLAEVRRDTRMLAASNTKLVTTYAALRVLGPNHRWRTRLSLVEEHDGAGGAARQGLLVEGGGDPTLNWRGLEAVALRLKAEGVRRIDGAIVLDGSLFAPEAKGEGLPPDHPHFIPLSPFVVESNSVEFTISLRNGAAPAVHTTLPEDVAKVVSRLQTASEGRALVRVEQGWEPGGGTFTLTGAVSPHAKLHTVVAPASQPSQFFYRMLRAALKRQGIEGDMPLRLDGRPNGAAERPRRLLFTHPSPPLRDAIADINKNSSNLGAELLVRALGGTVKTRQIAAADGMWVLRRLIATEFPGMEEQVRLVDGSGLSRSNELSPLFLVRLLNRALKQPEMGLEFQNGLAIGGWDGTLRFRAYPVDLQGRLRAKSGTLHGVSNLSGYLTLSGDTIVFAFLLAVPGRPGEALHGAQDRILAGLYETLTEGEIARPKPAAPPAPPMLKPRQAGKSAQALVPPPPSRKPPKEGRE